MYDQTPQQTIAEAALRKQGFRFNNWISAQDESNPNHGCMVMTRKPTRYTTEYREIDPNGLVDGQPLTK